MWCHLLLLLPVVGLGLFWVLPWPVALSIETLLVALALGIAIPGMRALYRPILTGREALVGKAAEAATDVGRQGLVQCQGELWTGTTNGSRIRKGARVKVVDVRGATLVVEPIDGDAQAETGGPMSQRFPESMPEDSMPEDRKGRGA